MTYLRQNNWLSFIALIVLFGVLSCCETTQEESSNEETPQEITPPKKELTQEQQNKAFAENWVAEVWHNKNLDIIRDFVSPEFRLNDPLGLDVSGAIGVQDWIGGWLKAFPDWTINTRALVSRGQYIGVFMWVGGTFTNDYIDGEMHIPATSQWNPRATLDIWRIVDGKMQEAWMSYDDIIFMQNVGQLPFELGPIVATAQDSTPITKVGRRINEPISQSEDIVAANQALLGQLVELMNSHDIDSLGQLLSDDITVHAVGQPVAVDYSGPEGVKEWITSYLEAMPDLQVRIALTVPEGNMAVVRWSLKGTFSGTYANLEGNRKSIETNGNSLIRFDSGKISEIWHTQKRLKMFQDFGVLPSQSAR